MEKNYGIFDAPDAVRRTRNAKSIALSKLHLVRSVINSLETYVESIPELDDADHCLLVERLSKDILNACETMRDCIR